MTTPTLWSWMLSPFAGKVRVAAAEKGVELELLEIDPRNRPARLRQLNPSNRVPVLETDGVVIRESTAICEWLEETYPDHPLWPTDPGERSAARGILRWVDDELTVNFFLSMRKQAFGVEKTDHPEIITHLQTNLTRRWKVLDDLLGRTDGAWLMGGDEPTLPDLAAIPLAVRLPQWKPELQPSADEQPRATAWLDALRARPSAAEVDHAGAPVAAD